MPRRRITQKQIDFIKHYLSEEANRGTVGHEFIDRYKEKHKSRGTPRYTRRIYLTEHRHGSDPFCNVCDQVLIVGDDIFLFYIGGGWGGQIPYHVSCFRDAKESKQLNIIYQDRAVRRKLGIIKHPKPEESK